MEYEKLLSGTRVEIGSPTQEVKGMNVVRIALTPAGEKAAEALAKALRAAGLSTADSPKKMVPWDFERIIEQGLVPISEAPVRVMVGVKPR